MFLETFSPLDFFSLFGVGLAIDNGLGVHVCSVEIFCLDFGRENNGLR